MLPAPAADIWSPGPIRLVPVDAKPCPLYLGGTLAELTTLSLPFICETFWPSVLTDGVTEMFCVDLLCIYEYGLPAPY